MTKQNSKDKQRKIKELEALSSWNEKYEKLQQQNTELKEKLKQIKVLLDLHFKCDCLACVTYEKPCNNLDKCEAYKTYKKVMDRLE